MTENTEQTEQSNGNSGDGSQSEGSQLRQQLETFKEQAQQVPSLKKENAFLKAGINIEQGTGSLLFDAYNGEPSPDAIRNFAEERGIPLDQLNADGGGQPQEPSTESRQPTGQEQARQEARERLTQSQQNSQPAAGQKVSLEEWQSIYQQNPEKGKQLREQGLVDMPPHIEQALASNRG